MNGKTLVIVLAVAGFANASGTAQLARPDQAAVDVYRAAITSAASGRQPRAIETAFSALGTMSFNKVPNAVTRVAILDLNTGKVTEPVNVDTHHQMFCVGLALLADGRVLINGGSNDHATTICNPTTNKWTRGPLMNSAAEPCA